MYQPISNKLSRSINGLSVKRYDTGAIDMMSNLYILVVGRPWGGKHHVVQPEGRSNERPGFVRSASKICISFCIRSFMSQS